MNRRKFVKGTAAAMVAGTLISTIASAQAKPELTFYLETTNGPKSFASGFREVEFKLCSMPTEEFHRTFPNSKRTGKDSPVWWPIK